MKTIKDSFKIYNLLRKNPGIMTLITGILKFVEETHKLQKPMVSSIAIMNMGDGTKFGDFVSLWAGIGEASAIERCKSLKAQNVELIRILNLLMEKKIELSKDDEELIKLTLKIFG